MSKDNYEYFKKWYFEISQNDARLSDERAQRDVRFLENILNLPKDSKILDLCCGHGRHLVLLAKKYNVTGIDMDENAVEMAQKIFKKHDVSPQIIVSDMRNIPFKNEFDVVINMYTSFGYFDNEKENLKVLKEINKSLKNNGLLVLDLRNKKKTENFLPRYWFKHKNIYILTENSFNKSLNKEEVKIFIIDKKGNIQKTGFSVKLYSLDQITSMLHKTGFSIKEKFGGTDGTRYTATADRMIIVAKKVRDF